MKRFDLRAWMVGSALALLVAAASWLDFPLGEPTAMDLMFVYGRSDPPPASRDIVLALVDDQAIESVGSWPWPREFLAECLGVIDRFGARVIAIDILFHEVSRDPAADEALENALAKLEARVILAVDPTSSDDQLGPEWQGRTGIEKWHAVLATLESDITMDARQVADRLSLDDLRAARVREKIGAYKRVVVRRKALELRSKGLLSEQSLKEALLPADLLAVLGDFPESHLLAAEVQRAKAAEALERGLPKAEPGARYASADGLMPPILDFARHADGPGVVKANPDARDGHMRRAALRWNVGGKIYPQLGAAAATFFAGGSTAKFASPEIVFTGEQGSVVVDGKEILLSWPAIERKRGALVFETCSLGAVVGFSGREKRLASLREVQGARSIKICREFLDLDPAEFANEHEMEEEIRDAVEFQLQPVEGTGQEEDEEARNKLREFRNWQRHDVEIRRLEAQLAADRTQLRLLFHDRLVFVGWSASGNVGDFFPTAIHPRTPGVVAHAVVANSLLTPYVVRRAPAWIGGLLALCLGLLSALVTRRVGPRFAFLFATLLAVVYLAFNVLLVFNTWRITLALVAPILGVYVASAGTTTMRAIRERREKAQLERQFGARISPQLFDFLVNHPDLVHLEGEEREVTCFFSDLAGFTSISESLNDSKATVKLLNTYMYEMNAELTNHSAYVNKFLGDGIMAIWGAFELGAPHAERACLAALGCRRRLEELNAGPALEGLPKLSMRIGIATGVVTVGDCGAPPDLRDYTVIGDTANLAARLESANKQFGTRILINGRAKELLPAYILTRPLGVVTVVGQKTPTEVHEVVSVAGEATEEQKQRIDLTTRGVEAYRDARFDEAVDMWRELRRDPYTGELAELYLAQIALFHGAPELEFDGVLHLTKK